MRVHIESINAKLQGAVTRGIREAVIDEDGHLILTLTDEAEIDLGLVVGADGVSIDTIDFKQAEPDGANTYTITLDNGETYDFSAPRGVQGVSVDNVVYVKDEDNGDKTYKIVFDNGEEHEFTVPKGEKGDTGNGIDKVELTSGSHAAGQLDTYTITFTDGDTHSFQVYNGANGKDGDDGNGIAFMQQISGTHAAGSFDKYRLNFTDGSFFEFDVYNGANGEGSGDMLASTYDAKGKSAQIATEAELNSAVEELESKIDNIGDNLAPVATSGSYNDLTDKPTLGTVASKDVTSSITNSSNKVPTSKAVMEALTGKADKTELVKVVEFNFNFPSAFDSEAYSPAVLTDEQRANLYSALMDVSENNNHFNNYKFVAKVGLARYETFNFISSVPTAAVTLDLYAQSFIYEIVFYLDTNNGENVVRVVSKIRQALLGSPAITDDAYALGIKMPASVKAVKDYVDNAQPKIPNHNFIKNAWFKSADNWQANAGTINVDNDGLHTSASEATVWIIQYVKCDIGKTYTLSVDVDGAISSTTVMLESTSTTASISLGGSNVLMLSYDGDIGNSWYISIITYSTALTIKAVKLEMGNTSTLADETAESYEADWEWHKANFDFKVGDILTTTRNALSDDWLLCNGQAIDDKKYPQLSDLCKINALDNLIVYPYDSAGASSYPSSNAIYSCSANNKYTYAQNLYTTSANGTNYLQIYRSGYGGKNILNYTPHYNGDFGYGVHCIDDYTISFCKSTTNTKEIYAHVILNNDIANGRFVLISNSFYSGGVPKIKHKNNKWFFLYYQKDRSSGIGSIYVTVYNDDFSTVLQRDAKLSDVTSSSRNLGQQDYCFAFDIDENDTITLFHSSSPTNNTPYSEFKAVKQEYPYGTYNTPTVVATWTSNTTFLGYEAENIDGELYLLGAYKYGTNVSTATAYGCVVKLNEVDGVFSISYMRYSSSGSAYIPIRMFKIEDKFYVANAGASYAILTKFNNSTSVSVEIINHNSSYTHFSHSLWYSFKNKKWYMVKYYVTGGYLNFIKAYASDDLNHWVEVADYTPSSNAVGAIRIASVQHDIHNNKLCIALSLNTTQSYNYENRIVVFDASGHTPTITTDGAYNYIKGK